jgi:uncharacterized membrane protein YdjX (TVP38/TMEM64 family)
MVALAFAAFLLLLRLFPTQFFSYYVGLLCEWVASMGIWAPVILGLIDAVGVAICFPLTVAFELAAGFLFGVVAGSTVISIAKTVGAAAALLLGRTLLQQWVQNTLKNSPHFSEVYNAMGKDTFKLAIMLRLSPVPSWVNNYGLSLTPITLKEFFLATILAGFPGVVRNVYIGSLMKSVSAPEAEDVSIWIHVFMGSLTIIASILVTKYLYKYFRMAMNGESSVPKIDLSQEDDLEMNPKTIEHIPTPPPETIAYPPSPLPTRQRIVPT